MLQRFVSSEIQYAFITPGPDKDILPLLRKQNGFKDDITFSGPGGIDVTAISLWDNKASTETYNINAYPEVLKTTVGFIVGTLRVQTG